MHLSLRTKLTLIVGATALSLTTVAALGLQLAWQQGENLQDLEQRLVPKLELEPRLASQFEQLGQAFKDAVAAQDRAALDATDQIKGSMFVSIERAGHALEPAAVRELRDAITRYHTTALRVSDRMLAGEAGEQLVVEIAVMQEQHKQTLELIERRTRLDRATLRSGFAAVQEASRNAATRGVALGLVSLGLVVGLSTWLGRGALRSLRRIARGLERFAGGRFDVLIEPGSNDELGTLAHDANQMATALDRLGKQRDASDWIRAGQVELAETLRGEHVPAQAARLAIVFLSGRATALAGAVYLRAGDGSLELCASYAYPERAAPEGARRVLSGQGLLGEAALADRVRIVNALPEGYLTVRSGLGEASARCLVLVPLRHGARAVGIVELALFEPCSEAVAEFLELVRESLAVALDSAQSRALLQAQKEELRLANDELEAQRASLGLRNAELEEARTSLQAQADELAQMSSYKSQFLANMSHELRTPLNSMLLLSQIMADNEQGNLSPKQVEHCRTIYSAGKGLLSLINQVLDLSKIEAGKQELDLGRVTLRDLGRDLQGIFEPQLVKKGLSFSLEISPELPDAIVTDGHCLRRILINLLGNALKFTERGSVSLCISRPAPGTRLERPELVAARSVAFAVRDTGIGISSSARERIFARFEQADARTVRRYGGTGLGLAIARESALLMGGDLQVTSREGDGSTFTCYLPERAPGSDAIAPALAMPRAAPKLGLSDDRARLAQDEPHLLIVEDDSVFAERLLAAVRHFEIKGVVASSGREALELARARPPAGIILDVLLPDVDGFVVRKELRKDPRTASIPVHFISGLEAPRGLAGLGVVGYLTKPASREELTEAIERLTRPQGAGGRVLLVEDDQDQALAVVRLLRQSNLEAYEARSAEVAVRALEGESFGCMILDLGLPDVDGLRLLDQLSARRDIALPPVVVHTARELSLEEKRRLGEYTDAVVLKDRESEERLLVQVRGFIGQLMQPSPPAGADPSPSPTARPSPGMSGSTGQVPLDGTKVLIADDDMRTAYALSALLRDNGAEVVIAENGREALRVLEEHGNVRAVLMDTTMPDMDGYEVMRRLREQPRFADLLVIALTTNAMQGERERCELAGASTYMPKPVDPGGLLSSLGHWLRRQTEGSPPS